MRRVTGIGGIFFKAKDPKALGAWYKRHLGIDVQDWGGAALDWTDDAGKPVGGTTAWSVFAAGGDQFAKLTLPVVGGTGTYANVRGYVKTRDLADGQTNRTNLEFHLLP